MTGVGTVSLAGIVVNNAIVMLDFVKELRRRGYGRNEAMILAAVVRFRPVMLTAITTVLGLVPMAIGLDISFQREQMVVIGAAGAVFWQSMAYAIMYGLGVSTFLTLVIVPVLYSLTEGFKERFARLLARLSKPSSPDPELTQAA
jgi:multidrug efflux pump subunit AcrB